METHKTFLTSSFSNKGGIFLSSSLRESDQEFGFLCLRFNIASHWNSPFSGTKSKINDADLSYTWVRLYFGLKWKYHPHALQKYHTFRYKSEQKRGTQTSKRKVRAHVPRPAF